jgi:hypothetical protein
MHGLMAPERVKDGGGGVTWVRLDDQFPIHRKVSVLTDAAYRLHTEAICWCARNGTDGLIRRDELATLGQRARPRLVGELVSRGVWHHSGHDCDRCVHPADGWVIHDYLTYQPTREEVERERAAKAERQRRWLEKRRNGRPSKEPSGDASRDGSKEASRDGPEDDAPLPPRPEGKRGGSPVAPPAAFGDGAPAGGEDPNRRQVRPCHTCGNAVDSAYHRNVCTKADLDGAA